MRYLLLLTIFLSSVLSENQKLQPSTCNAACTSCHSNVCYQCASNYYLDATTGTCLACSVCTSRQYESSPCNGGGIVWSSSGPNNLAGNYGSPRVCSTCSTCGAGTWESAACAAASNTVCTACSPACQSQSPPGYLTTTCTANHDSVCSPCTSCVQGVSYLKNACTETSDTVCSLCQTCASGTYSSVACSLTADTTCSSCTTCGEGFWISSACTSTSNTVCTPCTVCTAGQWEVSPCGDNVDTVCAACSPDCSTLSPIAFETRNCGANHDLTCQACTVCQPGYYEKVSCTETSDTNCQACEVCPDGSFLTQACGVTTDTVCSTCSLCPEGSFIAQACTATSDTVCQFCTHCISGTFAQTECAGDADAVCVGCSTCDNGAYISQECSATQDTQCTPCSPPCDVVDGFYEYLPCRLEGDRACQPYSQSCTDYLQFISTPGTPTSDVVYTTCKQSCPSGQFLSAMCTTTEDSTCSDCTVCQAGQFQVSSCGLDYDAVCQDCRICPDGTEILACSWNHDVICHACPEGYFPSGYPYSYDPNEFNDCPVHEEAHWLLDGSADSLNDVSLAQVGPAEAIGPIDFSGGYAAITQPDWLNFPAIPVMRTSSFTWSWSMNLPPYSSRFILFADWSEYLWSFLTTYEEGNLVVIQLRRDIGTSGSDPNQGLVGLATPITPGVWIDFAASFDHSTKTLSTYIDGVLVGSAEVPEMYWTPNLNLHPGSSNFQWGVKADEGPYGQFNGLVKNLRIFTFTDDN